MSTNDIVIRGAREHNLRNIDLRLPRNQLIVMTGVSGSGKSSLAFDTLYAEGQRRYVESLSSYARQFLGQLPKPDVDAITGLAPSISIQQKSGGRNPRSTVGTITEIYDYLRVLFARVGQGRCPHCQQTITAQSTDQILQHIEQIPDGTRFQILAPVIQQQKGAYRDLFTDLLKQGFLRARVDGRLIQLSDDQQLDRQMRHTIEVVVDRLVSGKSGRSRVAEAVETALTLSNGTLIVSIQAEHISDAPTGDDEPSQFMDRLYSARYACTQCGVGFDYPNPQLFSFNSPQGMCPECNGLGMRHQFLIAQLIPDDALSLSRGAIPLLGSLRKVGRWRRHIYQGVATAIETDLKLEPDSLFKTPWRELPTTAQHQFLFGLGDRNITFSWRYSGGVWKHGGQFAGYIPELLEGYRKTRNPMRRRQLEKSMEFAACDACQGARLNPQARNVRIRSQVDFCAAAGISLPETCGLSIEQADRFLEHIILADSERVIAEELLKEIRGRLGFLLRCGLDYLTLDRTAPTLSGGETQRIRLAGQLGCGLVGVVYILDEPSIGLHPRDNQRLLDSLKELRDQGNTVIVVEHDEETMRAADHLVDFGPGPGIRGGEVVAQGPLEIICQEKQSETGQFLSGTQQIAVPDSRRDPGGPQLKIIGARHNNLKRIDVTIPLGTLTCVTGVSGSGKSSLINDILWQALNRDLNRGNGTPGRHQRITGLKHLDKAIAIDQAPIGRTPRSNPATYIKLLDLIRDLFTKLPESRIRGFKPGRFSFNVANGRCAACDGYGSNKLEMDFLADIWVTCPVCAGRRYNQETLQVKFKGASIADILDMDVSQALDIFADHPRIARLLQTLADVGLDYLKLGQPSPTLSGGEAQRIKLARELGKRATGKTLYLLDEPTTGLHFADIRKLLEVLHSLVDAGNTVLVVEHNADVLKTADWLIDLGPDGGDGGGRLVACGTPEQVAACAESQTGQALEPSLSQSRTGSSPKSQSRARRRSSASKTSKNSGRRSPNTAHNHSQIAVRGAAQHNLQQIDVEIPRDRMIVFCGPSGSGKSSLAMDTLYAEGQRRYVESLSAYARQFLGQMPKPKVENIQGLSPAIAIEQKHLGHTPRSTVGTVTEIYDYLRILFARLGTPHCPDCAQPIETQTVDDVIDRLLQYSSGTRLMLLAPQVVPVGHSYDTLWDKLRSSGFTRVRVDGQVCRLEDVPEIDRRRKHQVEVVCDRITIRKSTRYRGRIAESVELAFELGQGSMRVLEQSDTGESAGSVERHFSLLFACQECGRSFEELIPHSFSFNSSLGWCPACEGLGTEQGTELSYLIHDTNLTLDQGAVTAWPDAADSGFRPLMTALCAQHSVPLDVPFRRLSPQQRRVILHGTGEAWIACPEQPGLRFQYKGLYPAITEASRVSYSHRAKLREHVGEVACSVCHGSRLRDDATAVHLGGLTMQQLCEMPLSEALPALQQLPLDARQRKVAGDLLSEATSRLEFLVDVGLHYLSLSRALPTLSGGETQRIRLAGQIGRALTGVLYVLDEPTIGLHPRDNRKLLSALQRLRDLGNTMILVEHDRDVLNAADRLYDFGPGAGRLGGQIVAKGTPRQLQRSARSLTGKFLSDRKTIPIPSQRRFTHDRDTLPPAGAWLELRGARHNNLRSVDLRIPLGTLVCVTGVSGSGKSSLIESTLSRAVARKLHKAHEAPGPYDELRGCQHINKLIGVDQQPLGNTPASNPATYTGVFDHIRELFCQLPDSRVRGYRPGRFSFNRAGGRCDACEGNGQKCIEMHFLPDVWVECDVCHGRRYNSETLAVTYHGHSIADVLEMPIDQALELFGNIPKIRTHLSTLAAVGLGYLKLGQPAPTLSGGEAQRVKLAAELARPQTGSTLYILDEPTTGLHFDDIDKLLKVIHSLVDAGNTVVVIEHNLDVIKTADWIVDLGPESGVDGGRIMAQGTPETIVDQERGQRDRQTSCTAEMLRNVLRAGQRADRVIFDPRSVAAKREGDIDIKQLGRDTRMPWQTHGRRWHTVERVSHKGQPARWQGSALDFVVDQLADEPDLLPPLWNERSVVEITGNVKKQGWFLHALTGDEWLLTLKFRVRRNRFKQDALRQQIPLKNLDDLDELPIYGRSKRLRVRNLKGPWQEISLTVHWQHEIETDGFREFLKTAVASFREQAHSAPLNLKDLTPWSVLGPKWHLSRKGFPSNKRVRWKPEIIERLADAIGKTGACAPGDWTGKSVVKFRAASGKDVLCTIHTKRRGGVDLTLYVRAGRIALGAIAELGTNQEIRRTRSGHDSVIIRFTTITQARSQTVQSFLKCLDE